MRHATHPATVCGFALLLGCAVPAIAQPVAPAAPRSGRADQQLSAPAEPRPGDYDRFHEFIGNTIKSPAFIVEAFGAAAIDQVNDYPKEWSSGDGAFLKRNAARFGEAFAASTIEASAASALHYHVGYEHCSCSGPLRRLGHAFTHTFVVSRVDGGYVVNAPFLVSRYTSAAMANAWYPASYTIGDVIGQGSFSLVSAVGLNVLDEFGPDLLHALHLR
jgi:hypothetical protein